MPGGLGRPKCNGFSGLITTKSVEIYFVLAAEKLILHVSGNRVFEKKTLFIKMKIQSGVYQHFKGKFYLVIGTAIHSETDEQMVVYQPLYGEQRWFVRPLAMFLEKVMKEGEEVQRFRWVGE